MAVAIGRRPRYANASSLPSPNAKTTSPSSQVKKRDVPLEPLRDWP
ncbi:MAG: hypothetical protein F6K44_09335 [Moorea sp. SIO3E2]|nr:hypothetical protein [Moorena sp. SIO3E2]NES43882.1 hypothetical protein [Moorena sp. SIO2C4]